MKFNQDGTEVQLEGDIENNKVSIDTANIDFIVTILSTNLYSNPIQSFLRETVSNGWDSHVEAGIDEPVILELGTTSEGQEYCKIQDFGVGLSPERFNNVYRNIGSSTKRQDNTMIGGFGIGRFSALAYSEMVNITSIYDGIEYSYLMYKDGNSISIDLLHQKETNNRNGVSIQVNIRTGDMISFISGIQEQLPFFENLYVDISNLVSPSNIYSSTYQYASFKEIIKNFNESVIKRYKNFHVTSLQNHNKYIKILLGKVLYPLNFEELKLPSSYPPNFKNYPLALKFEIGELQVTPNREQILYTDKNIKLIQERLDGAMSEIHDMIIEKASKDYSSLSEYIEAINQNFDVTLLKHEDKAVTISVYNIVSKATFNGQIYDREQFLAMYNCIMRAFMLPISFQLNGNKLFNANSLHISKLNIEQVKDKFQLIKFGHKSDLHNWTKTWIKQTFKNDTLFLYPIKDVRGMIRKYIKKTIAESSSIRYGAVPFTFSMKIFKIITKDTLKNLAKIPVISDSSVPKNYLDKLKADLKAKRALVTKNTVDWKQNMNLYPLRQSNVNGNIMVPDPKLISLGDLKKEYKSLVVYDEKDSNTLRHLASILLRSNIVFTEVAPTKMKLLFNLQNFVKLENFMNDPKYKAIRNIATAKIIKDTFPELSQLKIINNLHEISEKLQETVNKLYRFQQDYLGRFYAGDKEDIAIINDIVELCKKNNYYNFEILGLINENKKMINNAMFIINFKDSRSGVYGIPKNQIPVLLDYIVSRKLFIPNTQVLNEIKNPKLENNENS